MFLSASSSPEAQASPQGRSRDVDHDENNRDFDLWGPSVLTLAHRPAPQPQPGEVRIEVAAAGVNRPDLMQREGRYPPPPGVTDIPGLEVSGTIAELGPDDETGAPRSASGHLCASAIGCARSWPAGATRSSASRPGCSVCRFRRACP